MILIELLERIEYVEGVVLELKRVKIIP